MQHRIPTVFEVFEVSQGAEGGGLTEFGPRQSRMARRTAAYIDKGASDAHPAVLPTA